MTFDKEKNREQQKEKMNEMQNTIKTIASEFERDPAQIAELLAFQSKFHNYSIKNTMLIYSQNPGAAFCGSFKFWKDEGYSVKKGEQGIKIFVPVASTSFRESPTDDWKRLSESNKQQKEKIKAGAYETRKVTSFRIGTTFDIAQTTCPPEDYPSIFNPGYSSEQHAALFNGLKSYSENVLACPVRVEDLSSIRKNGTYLPDKNEIIINSRLEDTARLSTLSHELGHTLLHNEKITTQEKSIAQIEVEADAFSIMLQSHLGIELTEQRKAHLAGSFKALEAENEYNKDSESPVTLDAVLDNVSKTYEKTIGEITGSINNQIASEMPQSLNTAIKKENSIRDYCQSKYGNKNQLSQKPEFEK